MSGPFKMKGMSFKEDQTPLKTINLSKVASKIKSSKFGQSKLGTAVGNLAEKGGKVQEKFIAGKKKLGLKTPGYDATIDPVEDETSNDVDEVTTSTEAATPETPMVKRIKKKKSPARNYKKGYYGVK
tara:strand:+ start:159 stop:539 length:381 start_codon:yes stop_codon:yes gene_type:complete